MENPIDPSVNRILFHGIALTLSAGVILSLLRERWSAQGRLNAEFSNLRKAKSDGERLTCWKSILQAIVDDRMAKKCSSKIAISRHIKLLIDGLKLSETENNTENTEVCLKIVQKVFSNDEQGRVEFGRAGGSRAIFSLLAAAHKRGNRRLMEESASTLQMLTEVDSSQIVLPGDVPFGAEPAYNLSQCPAAIKMLRTLEPNAPIMFLSSVTDIFSNFASLYDGAQAIQKGVDNHSGIWYFLRLLSHHNHGVVENCARTVSHIARAGFGHDELCVEENLNQIADLISVNSDAKTVNAALTVIVVMLDSKHAKEFFHNLEHCTSALPSLFSVWCRGSDKTVRERAEVLVRLLERLTDCGPAIRKLIDVNLSNIQERKAMDEENQRRQMQQMQKQQMMHQMMMQQMTGGMGMDGLMGEE